ncbi:WG repeat-containing protein [Chryseobacterium caseinilyticum]|uniref:WG repeat-containing protein n=1 Tax=Chryseobacterium caseinilyticum TaxID=2771428 RepID=A0ABR8ZE92_9FLAO|nr:WG repeat-containing protein [Chryseobacterium caseinilyticum]MBD8083583.1 WG repeat-containing protein [Chryseobacterium caseinilyticum]
MSHRIYIYNASNPSDASESDVMMVEWGYDVPLLLQSLFTDEGFVAGNIYNNHTEPDNFGLYFDAQAGIENFKKLYQFLENSNLIDDFEKFSEAKENLFNYLDKLKQPYFHIDAWDVFNMSDVSHEEQAQQLLKDIQQNNNVFHQAIEANDATLLDVKQFTRESTLGFSSFRELLNYVDYDYGWEHIWQENIELNQVEIFEENELWGLKDENGNVLIQPIYNEFYAYDYYSDLAVVVKNEKYGYVDKRGEEITPLIFDDAYDFEISTTAIVKTGEKFGLINLKGKVVLEPLYEEMIFLENDGNNEIFTAKLNDKYGLITSNGEVKIDFISDNPFESKTSYFITKVNGQKAHKIFTRNFVYVGDYPENALEGLSHNHILVKPHKNQQKHKIFDAKGNLLVDDFDKIVRTDYLPEALVILKNKKKALLHLATGDLRLDFEYDQISEMVILSNSLDSDKILKVEKDGLLGVIDSGVPDGWIVEMGNYNDALFLSKNIYALRRGDFWALKYLNEDEPLTFEYDLICRKPLYDSVAYAFYGNDVYVVKEDGLEFANAYEVLEDVKDDYSIYYFDAFAKRKLSEYVKREIGEQPD